MYMYVITGVVLSVLIAVACSLVLRTRRMAVQEQRLPEDELAQFQQMREEGRITEEEYKRLKQVVASQTVEKVKEEQQQPDGGSGTGLS